MMMDNYNYHHQNNSYVYRKKNPKDENFNGGSRPRNNNNNNNNSNKRKSSVGNDWQQQQQSALSLEKRFCSEIGRVSWEKVLETQKYMFQYTRIINWEDSAVQEAFWNAKKRFWAKVFNHPCDIELPDPDIFIDEVDWDSNVDHSLISDLEKSDPDITCTTGQKYSGVVLDIPVVPEQYVNTPTGWGDAEEGDRQWNNPETRDSWNNAEKGCQNNGWEDANDHWGDKNGVNNYAEEGYSNNGWDYNHWAYYDMKYQQSSCLDNGWKHAYEHSGNTGVKNAEKDCLNNGWDNGYAYATHSTVNHKENKVNDGSMWKGSKNNKGWDYGRYNKKSDRGGQNSSRFKISRFPRYNNDQTFGRRGNFSNFERPVVQWKPVPKQW